MSEEELTIIKNRALAAEPPQSKSKERVFYRVWWRPDNWNVPSQYGYYRRSDSYTEFKTPRREDAEFIYNAREDVLQLVAEIERLKHMMQESNIMSGRKKVAGSKSSERG